MSDASSPQQSGLRITHIQGLFSPEHGGPAFSTANCCSEQARQGHRVSLRVLEGYPHISAARQMAPPIDQRTCQVDFPSKLGRSRELSRVLAADPASDIYHLHGAWLIAMKQGADHARRKDRPYVVELTGGYTDYELRRKWLRKAVARVLYQDAVLQRAAGLHVNSIAEGEMLRSHGFNRPIFCLPVGVDLTATRMALANSTAASRVRARPYILYLGRIHPTKGIELLIAAWKSLGRRTGDCQLVVAGTGEPEYVAECRRMAGELIVSGACDWIGQATEEEKALLYRDAMAYVLPSRNENFGNTVAEALASGTPVVTTTNTQWTMLEERECGWLAKADADSIERALERCLDAGEVERRRRGANGRALIESEYSIEVVVAKLIEVYRGFLEGNVPSRFFI
jgi:glycosyltransferase involved in cell wall biosynthesis